MVNQSEIITFPSTCLNLLHSTYRSSFLQSAYVNCFFLNEHGFHFVICQTVDHLKQMLETINVTYIERTFETATGAAGLGTELFVS